MQRVRELVTLFLESVLKRRKAKCAQRRRAHYFGELYRAVVFAKVLQRLVLFAAPLALTLLSSTAADAQVRRWSGPPECDDGDALFSRIMAPGLDIDATVAVVEGQLQLRLALEMEGERWRRVVVGESCEALVEVAVVVTTMAAELAWPPGDAPACEDCEGPAELGSSSPRDPETNRRGLTETANLLEARRRSRSEDPPDEPREQDVPQSPDEADVHPFGWPRWALSAHAGARLDALSLPSPRAAVDVGVHLRVRWLRVDMGFLASRVASAAMDDARAELGLAAGRIGACGGTTTGRFWLGGCAALELGVVRAAGVGVDEPRNERAFWAGLDLALRAELGATGRLSFYLEAGAMAPLKRPRFLLLGDVVHHTPALSPRVGLGLEVRLTR